LKLIDLSGSKTAIGEESLLPTSRRVRFTHHNIPPDSGIGLVRFTHPTNLQCPAKLAWLYEFEQFSTRDRTPEKNALAEEAVDRVFLTLWE
jgi:hypothetical protein